MKKVFHLFLFLLMSKCIAQVKTAEDYGYRHFSTLFERDLVTLLIKSKTGEENIKKPIFLFFQGSLAQPLIKTESNVAYPVFPFDTDSLSIDYHLVIISKPFIPLILEVNKLSSNYVYLDSTTGKIPSDYIKRNLPDYYVDRNIAVINFLNKQDFVDKSKLVVAGHSEGSTIAAMLAVKSKKVTHLIYASGNPLGRIMSMISRERANETNTDSTKYGENECEYWQQVVSDSNNMDDSNGDPYKATYDFSQPPIQFLQKLSIPVIISYGTKDWSVVGNDFLRVEMIRKRKSNYSFNAYIGLEHNFCLLDASGKPIYEENRWNNVSNDWLKWLRKH